MADDDWGESYDQQLIKNGGDPDEVTKAAANMKLSGFASAGGGGFGSPSQGNFRGGFNTRGAVRGGSFPSLPRSSHGVPPPQQTFGVSGNRGGFGGGRGTMGGQTNPFRLNNNIPRGGVPATSQTNTALPTVSNDLHDASIEKPMNPEEIALLNKFLHKTVQLMKDGNVDVHKQQADPNSPLHSVVDFRGLRLKPELLKALDLMGFQQPSKIQEFALPLLLMEPPTNIIAQSQSGTGKTAAFVLTMLSRAVPEDKFPQCLCLAPTFELAKQIGEVVEKMGRFLPEVKVHYAVKGTRPSGPITEQIVIGTPGKVIDYLQKYRSFDPSKITCLVLDEADVMISTQGHQDLSIRIYHFVESAAKSVQTMLFSATYDENVMTFATALISNAVCVTLRREEQTLPNIKQYFVECISRDQKYQAVSDLYSGLTIASAVIFTHTKASASWLAERMMAKGHEVALLHGDLTVEARADAIQKFKDGIFKVLITTNVCARGIDVSQVTVVINYDPPVSFDNPGEPDYDTYLHRIGRTGRFGKAGIAINFVDSKESLEIIQKIEQCFGAPIQKLDPSDLDQLEAVNKD